MWNSPADFFAMGGYGLYVWSSFGACALVCIFEPLQIRKRHQAIVQRLKREIRAEKFDEEELS